MAKPILIVRSSTRNLERLCIQLQKQMFDYHVIALPSNLEMDFEVLNVVNAHEYFAEEVREMVRETLNAVNIEQNYN